MRKLLIDAERTGYAPSQVLETMTVGDLISWLSQFDEDRRVFLRHDGGYTYGGITERSFETAEDEWDGEDEAPV
jgi:hypothetical protein